MGILVVLLLISLQIRVISLCLFVAFLFTVRRAGAIRIVMKRNRFDERESPNLEVSLFLFHLILFCTCRSRPQCLYSAGSNQLAI